MVKHLPAMRETWVQSLGQKDLLEKEMATHSSTLAWKIPWTEEPTVGYSPEGHKESDTTEQLYFLSFLKEFSVPTALRKQTPTYFIESGKSLGYHFTANGVSSFSLFTVRFYWVFIYEIMLWSRSNTRLFIDFFLPLWDKSLKVLVNTSTLKSKNWQTPLGFQNHGLSLIAWSSVFTWYLSPDI